MEQKDRISGCCNSWSGVVAEEGRWVAANLNSKVGQIEKSKNSPKECPIVLLHFLVVRLMLWDGAAWGKKCMDMGVAKDGRQGTAISNLIVVQIKIAKLTTWLANCPTPLLYWLLLDLSCYRALLVVWGLLFMEGAGGRIWQVRDGFIQLNS